MKICFATNYLPTYHKTWGGAEQACYKMAKFLVKNNQEVTVLATKTNRKVGEEFSFHPISILEDIPIKGLGYLKTLLPFDIISYFLSCRIFKKIKPDVVHLHNFNFLTFSLVLSAKELKIPVLFSVYDYWVICPTLLLLDNNGEICKRFHGYHCLSCLEQQKLDIFQKCFLRFRKGTFDWFLNKIDCFLVLSKCSARILEDYGIDKEKIAIIPLPLFEKTDLISHVEEDSILFVGWINMPKGLHILLEAMPKILANIPGAKLYVIETGEGKEYKGKIVNLLKDLKIEEKVSFLGKRSTEEVKGYLQRCNVVVIPEQWENMSPLILGEAAMMGKPIVASRIGGISEFIEDGKSGFLAEPKDSGHFARQIIWMLKNRDEAKKMGEEARKKAEHIFNEDRILRDLLDLYGKF